MKDANIDSAQHKFGFRHVVMQPTTLCNLNCAYCYLPDRKSASFMSDDIALAVAQSIERTESPVGPVVVVWHGGEPLAIGIDRFRRLLEPFSTLKRQGRVRHSVQTNGTLITEEWSSLFHEESFSVGVSLDGNELHNSTRITWAGQTSFQSVLHGIRLLQEARVPVGILAVINSNNITDARRFYDFLSGLGCQKLNINIEEMEGHNFGRTSPEDVLVKTFWKDLFNAWRDSPRVRVREFESALGWLLERIKASEAVTPHHTRDFWPTVAVNGDVVVLSPELAASSKAQRGKFVVGNVLRLPLTTIVEESIDAWYVRDFISGKSNCANSCEYYGYCGGGEASNKYFELGDIRGTETAHCRHTKKLLIDAVLEVIH